MELTKYKNLQAKYESQAKAFSNMKIVAETFQEAATALQELIEALEKFTAENSQQQ